VSAATDAAVTSVSFPRLDFALSFGKCMLDLGEGLFVEGGIIFFI